MDGFYGYKASWAGFVDYSKCYHHVSTLTWVSQVCIWLGTLCSCIPQLMRIVRLRTSYGISPLFIVLTSGGHFLLNLNIFSLHNPIFIGIPQVPFEGVAVRLLTFLNLFTLFILLYPCLPLSLIFFDKEIREKRMPDSFKKERASAITFSVLFLLTMLIMFAVFIGFIGKFGIGNRYVAGFGKVFGAISSALSMVHYIPQFVRTCIIKDNGSLSLIMLAIQAPGGFYNGLVMAIGQGEDWTTFLAIMFSAIQQGILLILCIYYKCQKRKAKDSNNMYLLTDSKTSSFTSNATETTF